jgi:diacylglycerol kinase (ATP)
MNWIIKRIKSFGYAFKGIWLLFRDEANAQIHLLAIVVVVAACIYFQITKTEWALVFIAIGMVVAAEAFNSAIEKLTDSIYKDHHETAGKIKDIAAGGVLVCAIVAVIIAILVFLPYIQKLFC